MSPVQNNTYFTITDCSAGPNGLLAASGAYLRMGQLSPLPASPFLPASHTA